jgi:V-type H+-transporting ATPase subunit F
MMTNVVCGIRCFLLLAFADTTVEKVEATFKHYRDRTDVAIIIINQHIADDIQGLIHGHTKPVPSIVVVPSKDFAYDPAKDPEMMRAKQLFSGGGD